MAKLYTKGSVAVDEILSDEERYNIKEDDGAAYKSNMQIELATPVAQAGTNIDAARINNMENGIDLLDTILDKAALNNVDTLTPSDDDFMQRKDGKWVNRTPEQAVIDILSYIFPVGALYFTAVNTNPATLLGFGTWVAWGSGRTLVGYDSTQTEFDAAEKTGGAKDHTLTLDELTPHSHLQDPHTHTQASHSHTTNGDNNSAIGTQNRYMRSDGTGADNTQTTSSATPVINNATAVNQSTGGGQPHNNLQPYIVGFMWKRTA